MNAIRVKRLLLAAGWLLCSAQATLAWGPEGHRVIGAIALDGIDGHTFSALAEILGTHDREQMVEWCNWPDDYRATEEGRWSGPQHYINMVPGASEYERERDCPDGMCVTEAIGHYAGELGNAELDAVQRRQAFGRVCHFVGDLHQPLHAGFGDDRGGNEFAIIYQGEPSDLHTLWDHLLIEERTGSWFELYFLARQRPAPVAGGTWRAADTVRWTNESHAFAAREAYPQGSSISDEFADRTWSRALDQLSLGGARLAKTLEATLAAEKEKRGNCRQPKETPAGQG